MNINFHYFAVKTLAHYAGFEEDDAQTIAYYSQQVDDFVMHKPVLVNEKPPEYFTTNKLAKEIKDGDWLVLPHPTGIDMVRSLEKNYRHTTLSPFHFIPGRTFAQIETEDGFSRAEYRCRTADSDKSCLINRIVEEAEEAVREKKDEKSLMLLGMAIHTYADTYAHCGFSGLEGWENTAQIKKVYNESTGKEEIPRAERLVFNVLPHIGHANAGTAPDISACEIEVKTMKEEKDKNYSGSISRNNKNQFLQCAREILDIFSRCIGSGLWNNQEWEALSSKMAEAMLVPGNEEGQKSALIKRWSSVFPEISYSYEKNSRFFHGKQPLMENWEDNALHQVTEQFYDFNIFAYKRAEIVIGSADAIMERADMLAGYAEQLPDEASQTAPINANQVPALDKNDEMNISREWKPVTELGLAVYEAGFEYLPEKDIIGSTRNNIQRQCGYCHLYDECAPLIFSIIDCEPIYFCYDGYVWMLELWKGQYGIETGCEAGLYYRRQDKEESPEEKLMGRMYRCVSDENMLDMAFLLKKNGDELFSRDWTKHWWLTGFHWGIYSEPEELKMEFKVRFPNSDMLDAFLHGGNTSENDLSSITYGLVPLGYNYEQLDNVSVKIEFGSPYTEQPSARQTSRQTISTINKELVKEYVNICKKYNITVNDPNVISEVLTKEEGSMEKALIEKLLRYFKGKNRHALQDKFIKFTV